MATLMKTNTKKYKANIQKAILDAISFEDVQDVELTNRQKVDYLLADFRNQANYKFNMKRLPNEQDRLADWLQGLPSGINLPYSNYDILQFAAKMHEVDKIPEDKEDLIIAGYWKHIAFHILKLETK